MLVQEYAEGGDLYRLLHRNGGRLSERQAVEMVLHPFLLALHYLHTRGIMHRLACKAVRRCGGGGEGKPAMIRYLFPRQDGALADAITTQQPPTHTASISPLRS